jgi:hypothetical protein
VVVKTAGKLGLAEVSGDVLVGHLLHTGLKQVGFLMMMFLFSSVLNSRQDIYSVRGVASYLLLTPGTATAGGSGLSVLHHAILVAVDNVRGGCIQAGEGTGSDGRHDVVLSGRRVERYVVFFCLVNLCKSRAFVSGQTRPRVLFDEGWKVEEKNSV